MSSKTRRKPFRIACTVRKVVAIMVSATLALSVDPAPLFLHTGSSPTTAGVAWINGSVPEA
jgi:hypothetical protein